MGHSCYSFESENFRTKNKIKSPNGVILQIVRNINLKYSICVLEQLVYPNCSSQIKDVCESFGKQKLKNFDKRGDINYLEKGKPYVNNSSNIIELSENAIYFNRITKEHCLYSTSLKKNKRSCDSYAQMQDGSFINILHFIVDGLKEQTVCRRLVTRNWSLSETHFLVE